MIYRLNAVLFLLLGGGLGLAVVLSSGANTLTKEILGLAVPTAAGLVFALAWWRKAARRW